MTNRDHFQRDHGFPVILRQVVAGSRQFLSENDRSAEENHLKTLQLYNYAVNL